MSDSVPPNPPNNPPIPRPAANPADAAADALKSAQQAVSELRENTTPVVAASGGDEAAAAALRAAQAAIAAAKAENPPIGQTGSPAPARSSDSPGSAPQQFDLPSFGATGLQSKPEGIDLLSDVNLNVTIELGRTRMLVEDVLRLGEGSVVELDKLAGDPVDVYVNDRHVARGEVLVLNDNFCVRVNEIVAAVSEGGPGASVRHVGGRVK